MKMNGKMNFMKALHSVFLVFCIVFTGAVMVIIILIRWGFINVD